MTVKPFNPYELTEEDAAALDAAILAAKPVKAAKSARTTKPQRENFVMVTASQADRLRRITNATTISIFLDLLFLSFAARGQPFTMPCSRADRDKRRRALLDLERCGLISAQRGRGKRVQITIQTVAPDATPTVAPDATLLGKPSRRATRS